MIRELFQAMPPEPGSPRGFLDHCDQYFGPSEGSRDLYDIISHTAVIVELMTFPLSEMSKLASKVREVFEVTGLGLSFCQLVPDVNALSHSTSRLFTSGFTQTVQTARAVKDVAMHSLLLVNTVTRVALFANGSELLSLTARQVFRASIVLSVTSLITDGSDLIRDCLEWQVEGKSMEEDVLALSNVIKNLSSVAVSALSLVAYLFGVALTEPLFVGSMVVLGTVYFTSKVFGYFYHKMVVEELSSARAV